MKNNPNKTQFTDADVSDFVTDYGMSESLVEYSEVGPTLPEEGASPVGGRQGSFTDYENRPTEVDDAEETVVEDRIKVVGPSGKTKKIRPVVGWLACTKGPCKGMDYRLHANYNKIGRDPALDVSIEDPKFSKAPVAWVGYFQETNAFFTGAESSTNVLYINGLPLPAGQSREFAAGDRMRMGDTELLFVPLCGESFTWSKDEKEEP